MVILWCASCIHTHMGIRVIHTSGPCLTTAILRCRKNSSQWQRSFQWKLHSHWLKFLRQRHVAVVRQGPGSDALLSFSPPMLYRHLSYDILCNYVINNVICILRKKWIAYYFTFELHRRLMTIWSAYFLSFDTLSRICKRSQKVLFIELH